MRAWLLALVAARAAAQTRPLSGVFTHTHTRGAHAAATYTPGSSLPEPTATFYLPLPLEPLADTFDTVDYFSFPRAPNPDVGQLSSVTFEVAIVIAVQGTVIYYDHHEDQFDTFPHYAHRGTTDADGNRGTSEIWGDGDAENGIPPGYTVDILVPGDVIELESEIDVNTGLNTADDPTLTDYERATRNWGGGDRVQSSHALAVTYYAFPIWKNTPKWFTPYLKLPGERGTLLAGAVEVFASNFWDVSYVAPFGTGDGHDYEYCTFYVQAGDDATSFVIQDKGGGLIQDEKLLLQGETAVFDNVTRGDVVVADRPVQVHLITGDVGSTWELRWYALTPLDRWGVEYIAPVAAELTAFWIYNDGPGDIEVSFDTSDGPGASSFVVEEGAVVSKDMGRDIPLPAFPDDDPGYTGVHFYSDKPFLVLMMMDNGHIAWNSTDAVHWGATNNQRYDWGAPVVPIEQLSTLVVVPMGRGCRCEGCPRFKDRVLPSDVRDCHNKDDIEYYGWPFTDVFDDGTNFTSPSVSRSVIWISPVAPCTIFINFRGKRSVHPEYVERFGVFGGRGVSAKGCASCTKAEDCGSSDWASCVLQRPRGCAGAALLEV